MYDVAIIGSGPAGISAAINFKLHEKNIIWFGTDDLSHKVEKSHMIANYPGVPMVNGADLNAIFKNQIAELGLKIENRMVTNIMQGDSHYTLLANNDIFEAKAILFAIGAVPPKGLPGESEFLGRGVSYCATCDGFLYKGKVLAVYCGDKHFEHEVDYLAELADKVYLYRPYKDSDYSNPKVEILSAGIKNITGGMKVNNIELTDGTVLDIDGVFILRNAVAPTNILPGLETDGPHIVADRFGKTNLQGCYAAGDCTGRPYQIAKAVGEGNVAADQIIQYLSTEVEG